MKTSSMKTFAAALAFMAMALATQTVHADTTAYTTTGPEADLAAYGLSGFEFTLNQDIDVTALGFTGISIGGGDTPHVTLWDASAGLGALSPLYDTGNIVTSVTSYGVDAGSSPSFVSVGTPISLVTGKTYLVTAPAYWEPTYAATTQNAVFATATFLTAPGGWNGWPNANYNFSTLSPDATALPTAANFQFVAAAVTPEPSTYAMLAAGLIVLVAIQRRRLQA